jgi:hypothetical protein
MKSLACLAAFILLFAPLAFSETAEEMISACRAVAKAKVSGGKIGLDTDFDSGVCWGAFAAFQQAIRYTGAGGKSYFDICSPANGSRSQLIQVFLVYAKRHPEKYNEDFFSVALLASHEAFQCHP